MKTTQPSKEQVRLLMQQRSMSRLPPPSPAEIRVWLGWNLLQNNARKV